MKPTRNFYMNIWIINNYATPPAYGGLVRHYYFSKYLTQMKHKVRILTASHIHNTDLNMTQNNQLIIEQTFDEVEYSFVKVMSYQKNDWRRIYSMFQFARNCVKAMKNLIKAGEYPDVIYMSSPSPFSAFTATRFANKRNFFKVLEVRDLWPLSITNFKQKSDSNLIIKILYRLEKYLYETADRLIFTMAGGQDYIKDKKWIDSVDLNKIYQINNGIDLSEFEDNKKYYRLSDTDLDNPDFFKIIFTGSIRQIYQLETIVETARIAQKKLPDVQFLIYGDGTEKQSLLDLVKEYRLKNIKFKGRVESSYIPYILSKADLTLMHSRQVDLNKYGISQNKLFEYLAAGKPVLSTVRSNYSLIEKYNCGIECKDQKPDTIFSAIQELYELSKKDIEAMGNSAILVAQNYDYSKLSQELNDIFNNLI